MGLGVCLWWVESRDGCFYSFLYMLMITTNLQIQRKILEAYTYFCSESFVSCLLFPSISSPSILKFLSSFPLSGLPNFICIRRGWLQAAYASYSSPVSPFPLTTISLYPFPKALLDVPASALPTTTLYPRPETVYKRGRLCHYYPNQDTFERERGSY